MQGGSIYPKPGGSITRNRACSTAQPRVHPIHAQPTDDAPESTGGTPTGGSNDYAAEATGLITEAFGYFAISGVTSEVDVSIFGGGILGPNEYSIQLNTNERETTSACAGHNGCHVWQQFVYATDYIDIGQAAVFIQYWLLGWDSACPAGWTQDGVNCFANSLLIPAPDVPITDLGKVVLSASASASSGDMVAFDYDSEAYAITFPGGVLDISTVWKRAEFNVVGNAGGARADFNAGSSITVNLALLDGSNHAPTCIANGGSTGESNNLNAGACTASGGIPHIQFIESLKD